MDQLNDRMRAFEARLSALKAKMEEGLSARAVELRDSASALAAGDADARLQVKSQAHRLRGIAGTYGHVDLTETAARLEQTAAVSPAEQVVALALQLASLAEQTGARADRGGEASEATPVAPQRAAPQTRRAVPHLRGAAGGPLRVLAIDDDPLTVRLLTLTLRDVGGFEATIVNSATAGLARLKEHAFDLVISDAMMPDMNGREFCAAARALGGDAATVPILILSAATADELGWTRANGGHSGWLRKPFRPSELVADLGAFIERRRAAEG